MSTQQQAQPGSLERAAHLADLYVSAKQKGVHKGWEPYIKHEAQLVGVSWERMERAIAQRLSSIKQPKPGE